MNQYTKEIEELQAEFRKLYEETATCQPKQYFGVLSHRFGTFKMNHGREYQLCVIPRFNENGKYEIEPTREMIDDKCTFDTFRECNPYLVKMFDIKDEHYHQLHARMNQIQERITQLKIWEKRENEQQAADFARIKEIENKLTEKERLQGELEELRNKYGQQ